MTQLQPGGRQEQTPAAPQIPAEPPGPTLRGAAQVIAVVPQLIGFRPRRSLVVLVTRDEVVPPAGDRSTVRGDVVYIGRLDLPGPELTDQLVAALAPSVRAARDLPGTGQPLRWMVLCYDVDLQYGARVAVAAEQLARELGAFVQDVLVVRDGTFRSVDDPDPAAWRPVPQVADVPASADLVLRGKFAANSRQEYVAFVRDRDESAAAATELAISLRCADPRGNPLDRPLRALGRWVIDGQQEPTPPERALIALALQDIELRDGVLARWLPDLYPLQEMVCPDLADVIHETLPGRPAHEQATAAAVRRLVHLAARIPRDLTAPLLTIAGFLAWDCGDGALANDAVEEALQVDPDYRMAGLLRAALAKGLSTAAMARISAETPRAGGHPPAV